jgi:hypothetical protein
MRIYRPAEERFYDEFVVESIVARFPVPGASSADRAAAVQELIRRGLGPEEIGNRMHICRRHIERLATMQVAPLPPIPAWTDREYPRCAEGHELSPDNVYRRRDRSSHWIGCATCKRNHRNNWLQNRARCSA